MAKAAGKPAVEKPPAVKVVMRKLSTIAPYDKNPRKNDAAVGAVAKSIAEFGFQQPIVVDADGIIIVGHTRYRAAIELNLREVPVIVADQLTPAQVKAYRIADNKTNELAEWDMDLLRVEIGDLQLLDVDIDVLGFSAEELAGLLGEETTGDTSADPKGKLGGSYTEQFGVIVLCEDEAHQKRAYASLIEQGWNCKVVNT